MQPLQPQQLRSHANNILEVREASRAYRANAPVPLVKWQPGEHSGSGVGGVCSLEKDRWYQDILRLVVL